MSRIRTIKPEFWSSEQVMECSPNARLLFVGMWNFADDAGRMTNSAKRLKAQIFPSDDFSSSDIQRLIDELSSNDLLLIYNVENVEYIQITGWKHQKIDHAQPSKLPAPPIEIPKRGDPPSSKGRRTLAPEGNGKEGKGEESKNLILTTQHLTTQADAQKEFSSSKAQTFDDLESRCREAAGLERDPSPGLLVIGPIFDLIEAGWSLEAHILPAMKSAKARGKRGQTWGYYAKIVTNGQSEAPKVSAPPALRIAQSPFDEPANWPNYLRCWKGGNWPGTWGPQPNEPGCKVPPEFVADWEKSQRVAA